MKQKNTFPWEKIPVFSQEWTLSDTEKTLLDEKDQKEYHERVEKYWENRSLGACFAVFCSFYFVVVPPILASSITIAVRIDSLSNLSIAAIVVGTAAFVATGLAISVLIGRKLAVGNMQNPKNWKDKRVSEILSGREIVEADKDNRLENKKHYLNRNFQKRHAGI